MLVKRSQREFDGEKKEEVSCKKRKEVENTDITVEVGSNPVDGNESIGM